MNNENHENKYVDVTNNILEAGKNINSDNSHSNDSKTNDGTDNNESLSSGPANLIIHNIFIKDVSYEAPGTPQAFSLIWEPQVKFDIQVMRRVIEKASNLYEVILHSTISTKLKMNNITAKEELNFNNDVNASSKLNNENLNTNNGNYKQAEELVAFLIDVKLAGMFTVSGLVEDQLDRVLSTTAPTILFPYVAETISSLVTRGGFPQFILPPIDFTTLYQQRLDNTESVSKVDEQKNVTVN